MAAIPATISFDKTIEIDGITYKLEPIGYKQCTICNEIKPIDNFTKRSANRSGISCYCKSCNCQTAKNYRKQKYNASGS